MTVKLVGTDDLTKVEAEELQKLLAEVRPLNFRSSAKLSDYIVEHQLGRKYPNISGTVKMEEEGTEWDLKGGFSPRVYKKICEELELHSQGTKAKAIGFEPSKVSTKPIKRADRAN